MPKDDHFLKFRDAKSHAMNWNKYTLACALKESQQSFS